MLIKKLSLSDVVVFENIKQILYTKTESHIVCNGKQLLQISL